MPAVPLPRQLAAASRSDGRAAWLAGLPAQIQDLADRWSLQLGAPFEPGGQTAWVAPVRNAAHGDVVLKVGWRHMEAEDEAAGLRAWRGDGAIRVFAEDRTEQTVALLLERCVPGAPLAERPEDEQDRVLTAALRRLWRAPADGAVFRPLRALCDYWADSFEQKLADGRIRMDPGLARAGAELFRALPASAGDTVLLCTDLHAGNVLAAEREAWLVIDPKPFAGDPTYDALQHLLNCPDRLRADPRALALRMARLLDLDPDRLVLWLFARCVVEAATFPWGPAVARRLRP
jgi:streptomycin 6-kinase